MSYWDHAKPLQRSRAVDVVRIAEQACALLDEGGETSLTLRAVAQRLGVAAASIYSRVEGVEDIMDLALDHALMADSRFQADLANETDASAILIGHYHHLARHQWAIGVIARRPPRGPAYLRLSEALCSRLVDAGHPDPLSTAYAASNYVLGCAATVRASMTEPGAPIDSEVAPVYAYHQGSQTHSAETLLRLGVISILDSGANWQHGAR